MRKNYNGERSRTTSWQKVAPWYSRITEHGQGHYFHQHVIIPKVIKLLDLNPGDRLLDLACGNGVLGKHLPQDIEYMGVDVSSSLIMEAQKTNGSPRHIYKVANITKLLTYDNEFTHAAIILALQNIENPEAVFKNAGKCLKKGGIFVIVLNHPVFRIPRQTSWEIDEKRKIQFRRIDRYLSPLKIPINMNPSDRNSQVTWSYHFPISAYSRMLHDSGFCIDLIEEWISDKNSSGKAAKMENRGRSEFPLFMAIKARKI